MFRLEGLPVVIKRILLFAIVVVAAMLQNTDGLLPVIFGARIILLIPVVVCIGMCEGEMSGLVYGLIGGAFWDVCASGIDGFHGFYLAFIGCLSGILVHFIMRNRLLTQYCICTVSAVFYCVFYWFATVYSQVGDMNYSKLLGFYLPGAVITTAFSFIVYFIIRFICSSLKEKEPRINSVR
ncbi:MAG: hypothetical protein IJZ35_02390 [Clostridia bacterium]|nr:hypothetical protein [Clostridia bacterium]